MKYKCSDCSKDFQSEDSLNQHNKMKHSKSTEANSRQTLNLMDYDSLIKKGFIVLIAIVIGSWAFFAISNAEVLPPTTMQGHVEVSPKSHILKKPMEIQIQKHMLEHSDGSGPPGVIINYNCENFTCEEKLIEKLESYALQYPEFVYVAPFPNMSEKIILTKLGKMQRMENYDNQTIIDFILN